MLELSTRFSGITTGTRPAKQNVTTAKAIAQGIANLRYISRPSAVASGDTVLLNLGSTDKCKPDSAQAIMRRSIRKRGVLGGRKGVRVAEKLMCSLPNDFIGSPAREAIGLIAKTLADGSPDVKIYAVIHTDKKANLHAHFLVIDGLETRAQAELRTGGTAQRVRRRSVVRMNDRGRPKEIRQMIGDCINSTAERHGLTKVEYRSFRDRQIEQKPTRHRGPNIGISLGSACEHFLSKIQALPIEDIFPDQLLKNKGDEEALLEVPPWQFRRRRRSPSVR